MKHNKQIIVIDIENTNHPMAILDLDVCNGQLRFDLTNSLVWPYDCEFQATIRCEKCGHYEEMTLGQFEDYLNGFQSKN